MSNLYHSPLGLFTFQAEGAAMAYLKTEVEPYAIEAVWDTGCIQGDAEIVVNRGGASKRLPLREVVARFHRLDPSIPTYVQREIDGTVRLGRLLNAWESGVKQTYTVLTESGRSIRATDEHPFLTESGWKRLDELTTSDLVHVRGEQASGGSRAAKKHYRQVSWLVAHPYATRRTVRRSPHRVALHRLVAEAALNQLDYDVFIKKIRANDIEDLVFLDPAIYAVHHRDHDHLNNDSSNLAVLTHEEHHRQHSDEGKTAHVLYKISVERVVSIEPYGEEMTYDLEVADDPHNFIANGFVVHNTGKTHLGMVLACLLVEDDKIDHVIVAAEANKVLDWVADFGRFTDLEMAAYHGTIAKRRKILAARPRVLVSTYETLRNDGVVFRKGTKKVAGPGEFAEAFRGKRLLVIYDEVMKLSGRSSQTYQAHHYLIHSVFRPSAHCRVLALTATPCEKNPEGTFNQIRILSPAHVGTVGQFEADHVRGVDLYGNANTFKNIWRPGDDRTPWDGVTKPFAEKIAPVIIRKRKTDPDVMDQFPRQIEEPPTYVELGSVHQEFYQAVIDLVKDEHRDDPTADQWLFGVLRQIAAHPMSLTRSQGKLARRVVEHLGAHSLQALGAAKVDRLVDYLRPIIAGQGAQAVVFTFYGQSVLPFICDRLRQEGFLVAANHGGLSTQERFAAQEAFKAGDAQVFLSSDAGARGLNLGVGMYLMHYELPLIYATYEQRSNRIHRIDSVHPSVTISSMIAKDTVEEGIAELMLKRNTWTDAIRGDIETEDSDPGEQFLTAEVRAAMFRRVKRLAA